MRPWSERYAGAVADPNVASGLLEFQRGWRVSRGEQIAAVEARAGSSFDQLRQDLAARKDDARAHRTTLIDQFRTAAEARGTIVVQVADGASANRYVAGLCRRAGTEVVVKAKSMVSEEIGLNDALAVEGINAVETDLGEWLLQLAHEHPSHLVLPAIHKRRHQIADLLTSVLGRPFDPDDIPAMVRTVRTELRHEFLTAGVGVTGANALVASTGGVVLVTNEGNAGLTITLPAIHVVLAGFDKLVASNADAVAQLRLLAASATGQPITTYTSFLAGPTPGHELHIVLIDNGRAALAADPLLDTALRCIRCGACADVCPPYQVVGGHAFGHVYTGAIGLVTTPAHHGLDAAVGPQSLCVSCGACADVCPVDIPLPAQILEVRRRVHEASVGSDPDSRSGVVPARRWRTRASNVGWRLWESPAVVAVATVKAATVTAMIDALPTAAQQRLWSTGPWSRWTAWRTPPRVPWRSARSRLPRHTPASDPAAGSVTLFLQCITDRVLPNVAIATHRVLQATGAAVDIPPSQHCCGLPAFDRGNHTAARRMARRTIAAMEEAGRDAPVVCAAPSCVAMIVHEYPTLFAGLPGWRARAEALAARTSTLVGHLSAPITNPVASTVDQEAGSREGPALARLGDRAPAGAMAGGRGVEVSVAVHPFCQSRTMLGEDRQLEAATEAAIGTPICPLDEREVCCGFGGSVSIVAPEVSAGILRRKLDNVDRTGAAVLVTDNPGCALHLQGGVDATRRWVRVRHIAEVLADRLPPPPGRGGER